MFMKILWIIFLIIIIILILKIKIQVNIEINGTNTLLNLKIGKIEIKKTAGFIKRKQTGKFSKKNKKIRKQEVVELIKLIELCDFDAKINVGLILLFPTVFAVPIFSVILEFLRALPFKEVGVFKYSILPEYDKLMFNAKIKFIAKIRIFDFLRWLYMVNFVNISAK